MTKNMYISNLAFHTTVGDLTQVFSHFGTVTRALIVTDTETNQSRGFGFVEMSDGADQAIAATNDSLFQGRSLTVKQAKPREERLRSHSNDFTGTRSGDVYLRLLND